MGHLDRPITLEINGMQRALSVTPSMTLLEMVRTKLGLTGSKECCSVGECGACTMIVNGAPINSCLMLAVEAEGARVTTVEGLGSQGMTSLQEAFLKAGAVQCGFCIPGMVVAATALLAQKPTPSKAEIREGLSGNLCRCGGYSRITEAVSNTVLVETTDV